MKMRNAFCYSATIAAGIGSSLLMGCGSSDPQPSSQPGPVEAVKDTDEDRRFNVDAEVVEEPSTAKPGFEMVNLPGSIAGSVEEAFAGESESGEETSSGRLFGAMSRALYRGLTTADGDTGSEETAPVGDSTE